MPVMATATGSVALVASHAAHTNLEHGDIYRASANTTSAAAVSRSNGVMV